MRLQWESSRSGLYRGFAPDGRHELAQVGRVRSPDDTGGARWIVWLPMQRGELFDQFSSPEAAIAAAEAAVDPG